MALFYSATAGFLDDAIHATLPSNAQPIGAVRYRDLLAAQASGAVIEANEDGRPRIRRPVVTLTSRRATLIRQVKREAARRIEAISPLWRQSNDLRAPTDEGSARFAAIDAIRAASDALESEIVAADSASLSRIDIAAHAAWPA